jgi:hypothetical protein
VPLDETLLAVLREEADREIRARAEETARAASRGVEMQPELGLETAPALRIRPRAGTAALPASAPSDPDGAAMPDRAVPPVPTDAAGPGADGAAPRPRTARRELLPDIDRINSTLDASRATRSGAAPIGLPDDNGRKRQGFRSGFLAVLLLAALGWTVYAQAGRIADALPAAAPAIGGFVAVVDGARLGLDRLVSSLLATLNG